MFPPHDDPETNRPPLGRLPQYLTNRGGYRCLPR